MSLIKKGEKKSKQGKNKNVSHIFTNSINYTIKQNSENHNGFLMVAF